MILNDRILAAIVTLADELHFGCAAAKLHVSQPALSGTIKSLERDLGVRLFTRNSRRVELTEAGRILVAEARRLTADAERILALVRRSSEILGPIRIGYPASINLRWLSALVCRSRQDASLGAELEFVSVEEADLHEELLRGTLHAGFFPGKPTHPDLASARLFRETFAAALNPAHPMRRPTIEWEELRKEPIVWLRRDLNPALYQILLDACSRQDYRPNIVQEVRTFFECAQFAREGVGVTLLPASLRWAHEGESVVFVNLPTDTLAVESALVYRRDRQSKRLDRFIRFVQRQLPATDQRL